MFSITASLLAENNPGKTRHELVDLEMKAFNGKTKDRRRKISMLSGDALTP